MKRLCTLVLQSVALWAADDSATVLAQCRERILNRAERLPNYTCNETVDRSYYARQSQGSGKTELACREIRNEKLVLGATDRVRLEVKISEGKEIGSWPGASQFDS